MCLVDLVQNIWRTGETPQELWLTLLFLMHKGYTYTRGMELLKTLWNMVEALIDSSLRAIIHFHSVIHGF